MDDIQMNLVTSSNIAQVGYRESDQTLRVSFKSGGTYDYPGVSMERAKEFMTSNSIGKYYHTNIKGKYEGVKLEPATEKPTEEELVATTVAKEKGEC